jgi:hypothetical protein
MEHTALLAYVFSPAYQVPEKLVAETPALRKKTNSIRGTAGLKRILLIKEKAKQKKLSTNWLEYMDWSVQPEAAPQPAEGVAPRPAAEAAEPPAKFALAESVLPFSSDDEVHSVIHSH